MNKFRKWLTPGVAILVTLIIILGGLSGCAPASLGEIFDPSGNPFAHRFSDVTDLRTATYIVAASDSVHKYEADYFCDGTNDHVQIQTAIDALPATGGEVLLLDGTYNVEVALVLDSYQTLAGCGRNTLLTTSIADLHIITATGGSGTEKVGVVVRDLFVDGDSLTGDYGIIFRYVDYSQILNCWGTGFDLEAIFIDTSDNNVISGNITWGNNGGLYIEESTYNTLTANVVQGNSGTGLEVYTSSHYNTVVGNTCSGNTENGIEVQGSCYHNSITGNNCCGNGWNGIRLYDGYGNLVSGNQCSENTLDGISVEADPATVITGNASLYNLQHGIYVASAWNITVSGNAVSANQNHGIYLDTVTNSVVSGNMTDHNSQETTNTWDNIFLAGGCDDNLISDNLVRRGTYGNRSRYGINVSAASCDRNRIFDNDLYDGGTTAPFNDAGTNTELPSITVPFSDGSDAQDSGYLIDADTEYARAWLFLNLEAVQVVRIKVYARAAILEADKMRAEFVIYGGADNEAYTTHNGSVANHPSTSSNFAADDVIYWTITEAGVLALLGGDSVEVKVLHEAVGDGDIDTQAYFRTVTIEYQ